MFLLRGVKAEKRKEEAKKNPGAKKKAKKGKGTTVKEEQEEDTEAKPVSFEGLNCDFPDDDLDSDEQING